MTTAEVRADIERYTRWNVGKGQLTVSDVDRLVLLARRTDADGNVPDLYTEWIASQIRTLGDKRVPTIRNGYVFRVTVAGTSGATEPIWPTTVGLTVVDGTVTWVNDSATPWLGGWDAREAAAVGWEWRAASLNDQFGPVEVGAGRKFSRQWSPEWCLKMAAQMRGLSVSGIVDGSGGAGMFSVQLRTNPNAS